MLTGKWWRVGWRERLVFADRVIVGSLLSGLIRLYRLGLAPWFAGCCRFTPSCSAYGLEAVERHGAARGMVLLVSRLSRCQPFYPGGIDPVP